MVGKRLQQGNQSVRDCGQQRNSNEQQAGKKDDARLEDVAGGKRALDGDAAECWPLRRTGNRTSVQGTRSA